MSEWERNSTKDGSGNFNPPVPDAWTGSNNASAKTSNVSDSVRQGGTPGEWNPPASGADTNGTSSGYNFPDSIVDGSPAWESNSASRK